MTDFFISYTTADKAWAEWMAFVLEEEGFSTKLQAWDFRPGNNFVLEMQTASAESKRTIIVLSPDYLNSQFAAPEWVAAFVNDPHGTGRKLVPVMIHRCQPEGLLKAIVYIDLVDQQEDASKRLLMHGVRDKRAKPSVRPRFPGRADEAPATPFPGPATYAGGRAAAPIYMPAVRRAPTDVEKRRFIRQAFETIRGHIEAGLTELARDRDDIDVEFQPITETEFAAEIFLNGNSACRCRIWQGGVFGEVGITVADGHGNGHNSFNEQLSVREDESELHLSAMGAAFGGLAQSFDLKRMNQMQAADYLWRRFVAPLEYRR